jgi:hypothetical protein
MHVCSSRIPEAWELSITKRSERWSEPPVDGDEPFAGMTARLRDGGDNGAAAALRRLTRRLIVLARTQLELMSQTQDEAADVGQSAYKSFLCRYRRGNSSSAAGTTFGDSSRSSPCGNTATAALTAGPSAEILDGM